MPTAIAEPAGAASTARMMKSVEPTWSASSTTSWAHSGWTITMPPGCSARNASTLGQVKRWWTEQWPFHSRKVASFTSASCEPAEVEAGVPHPHVVGTEAQLVGGVAAEVLVGEEQHLVGPLQAPRTTTAWALDDVHTAPPLRPTNAFRAADEFM